MKNIQTDGNPAGVQENSGLGDESLSTICLPRWVVYFQAGLLGLVATTCFIFGIMVGSLGSVTGPSNNSDLDFRITGSVSILNRSGSVSDPGAVVFLLPDPPAEISRQDPQTVRPNNFEPLENPTIDWIRQLGGSVVRTNSDGNFELFAKTGNYHLLVVSKSRQRSKDHKLSKSQVAAISQYFLPVEKLIQNQQYYWEPISIETADIEIDEIEFE